MAKATIIAGLTAPPSSDGRELRAVAQIADWLEVRADIIGDLDPNWIRNFFPGRLLYSLRSSSAGGAFKGSEAERASRLLSGSKNYDLVELEANTDLRPELIARIDAERRMLSWYGRQVDYAELVAHFQRLSSIQSRIYKMVAEGRHSEDALGPLCLMKSLRRSDLIAYASGESGFWSRLVALQFGAPIIFGSAGRSWESNGSPSVFQLIDDYRLPYYSAVDEIYGIVGNPVIHSLSPRIHNAAYRAFGLPALFVPFQVESFDDFWRDIVTGETLASLGLSIKGLTVASPYKEAALIKSQVISQISSRVGAANVLVREDCHWKADTTDSEGVASAISKRGLSVIRKKAAVVGCGGAGRAVAAALQQAGANVTLVNRGVERGRLAAGLLGLPFVALSSFNVNGFPIVVNATPLGRNDNKMPFELKELSKDAMVIDLVYGSRPTPLVSNANALGRAAIDGQEILLIQVCSQFRKMTGRNLPTDLAYEALGCKVKASARTQTV